MIGSRNSSNSNRLVDVARAAGVPAHLIDDETRDRRDAGSTASRTVGITSGASAPEHLVTRVCDWFRARGVERHRAVPDGRRGRDLPAPGRAAPRARRSPRAAARRQAVASGLRDRRRVAGARVERRRRASRRLIQSACVEQVGVARGERQRDAVGELEAGLLAQRVDVVDQLVDAALARELVVERGVERDRDAVLGRDRPALLARRARRAPRRARARARRRGSARRRAPRTRRPASAARTAPSSFPSFGPSTGRFGLTRSSASTCPKLDLLHAQLVGDLVGVRRGAARRPRRRAARSGWRSLTPDGRARLVAERRRRAARPRSRRAAPRRARAPPASRRGRPTPGASAHGSRTSTCQRCSARNGITGATRAAPARARARASAAPPRRRPRSGGASGGCTSSRGRRRTPRRRGSRRP